MLAYDAVFPTGNFRILHKDEKDANVMLCLRILLDDILMADEACDWLRAQSYLLEGCMADPRYAEDDLGSVLDLCKEMKKEMPKDSCVGLMKRVAREILTRFKERAPHC